ncbi:MAG: filament integrity protein FraC [Cyanobacteria bacterium J06633_23]
MAEILRQIMGELEPVFPFKAVIFQILFLLVAIALEAMVLRQKMRLGYKQSVRYAAAVNLLAVVVGWFAFLAIEPLIEPRLQAQVISYVLFDNLINNTLKPQMGWIILVAGLGAFFITLMIKLKGLELLMRAMGTWKLPAKPKNLSRQERYSRSRTGTTRYQEAASQFAIAVLQANALSFSAILLLLVLRSYILRSVA